jgi:hypothetical protein
MIRSTDRFLTNVYRQRRSRALAPQDAGLQRADLGA